MVGGDATVYVGTLDGHVVAVSPTGSVQWTLKVEATVTSIAMTSSTLYVVADDLVSTHVVHGVSTTGEDLWSTTLLDSIRPPIVTPDGSLLMNEFDGGLVVLGASGAVVASLPFGSSPTSYGLAVTASGVVLAGSGDGMLYAFGSE